jgi:hypothetical protein
MNIAGIIARLPISEQFVAAKALTLVGVCGCRLKNKAGSNKRRYRDAGVGPAFESCQASVFLHKES